MSTPGYLLLDGGLSMPIQGLICLLTMEEVFSIEVWAKGNLNFSSPEYLGLLFTLFLRNVSGGI